jgi:hypothetical protein
MGKIPEKTLVESAFAIFDTLRRGIPNVFPGLFPVPVVDKKNCESSLALGAGRFILNKSTNLL